MEDGEVEVGLFGEGTDERFVEGVVVYMAGSVEVVIAVFDTVDDPVKDFDHEGKEGLFVVFAEDVFHAEDVDIVEGIGEGKKDTGRRSDGYYLEFKAVAFVPDFAE